MWVKICGLTNLHDAQTALQAGADALGFLFVRSSSRYLPRHSPHWQDWLTELRNPQRRRTALPSQNPDRDYSERSANPPLLVLVMSALEELPPAGHLFDAIQWVVPEGASLGDAGALRRLTKLPLWIALRFPPALSADDALEIMRRWSPYTERFVIDTYHPNQLGGTGVAHDWQRAAQICMHAPKPVILAGGLTPENVAEAVRTVRPAGVDVSSGVEAQIGRKDPTKVQAFIQRAKMAAEGEVG
ncbi:MAG: N-(5'-phosphoribosyl)anthranilate isomerase [Fimbriimonadales bacterium]|nr:MAG: N-(5'-phosphoribosyl)anthranilate isomerase [Fimbriimonadales bacterium]